MAIGLAASATATTFTFDGINSPGDMYTMTTATWFNDHNGTNLGPESASYLAGEQKLNVGYRFGQDSDEGMSPEYFWLLISMPLGAKNMFWTDDGLVGGDYGAYDDPTREAERQLYTKHYGNHHDGESVDMDFKTAWGSEQLRFGSSCDWSVKKSGASDTPGIGPDPIKDYNVDDCEYVINPSGEDDDYIGDSQFLAAIDDKPADAMLEAKTAINYVLDKGICDADGDCDEYDREFTYEMKFDISTQDKLDEANLLVSFFENDGGDVNTHLSPERGSTPLDNTMPPVPVPAALPLLAGALGMFGAASLRRRRRSA